MVLIVMQVFWINSVHLCKVGSHIVYMEHFLSEMEIIIWKGGVISVCIQVNML